MVRKTTPVRMTHATTNTSVTLKSTSVSPGAVMKNGTCVVAIGLGDAVKNGLPGTRGGAAAWAMMDRSRFLRKFGNSQALFQIGQR